MVSPEDRTGRPLITVVITAYNYAHYLPASIGSVLSQDFPSFELLVLDNASTDDTEQVVARYAVDARLRYIKNPRNIGLTPNHNLGLREARGKYISFVSADDMMLPGHLRRCYDYLEAHPATDVLYTGVIFIDADGNPFGVRSMLGQLPVDYDGGRNEFAQQFSEGCYIPCTTLLIRRSLYDELGGWDESFTAADYDITLRWAAAGKRFAYLRVPSVAIRLHGPQASGANYVSSGDDIREYLTLLERFVVPANERLLWGYQATIMNHLRWRAGFFQESLRGAAMPADLKPRVDAMLERIAKLPRRGVYDDLRDDPVVSVIVRIGTIAQMMRSLTSLAAQVDAPRWEAIVVGEGGPDYGPLLQALPYAERVRFVRMDPGSRPPAARNLGIRLAAGRVITYMEPGTTYHDRHLAALHQAFASGVPVVRSRARLLICESQDGTPNTVTRENVLTGLFRGEDDESRDFVAPAVPIDTVSHVRKVFDQVTPFRTDMPYGDTWDFWLRLRALGAGTLPWETVDIRVLTNHVMPDPNVFLAFAHGLYEAHVAAADSALAGRRAAYLRDMTAHFQRGGTAFTDINDVARFVTALYGVGDAPLTPA